MVDVRMTASENDAQLGSIATRLLDIAGCVASEAETATAVIRGMSDHAMRIASLAADLQSAANEAEIEVRRQVETLANARSQLAANKPIIEALAGSVEGVAAISVTIAQIAKESRMLSLNARIEAARSGEQGGAFVAIASEMSSLTTRTAEANATIGERSSRIARDVGAANDVVAAHTVLAREQDALLSASLEGAGQRRQIASQLVEITADTAGTVDRAASAIGRVAANAVAAKVLARQITRLARS